MYKQKERVPFNVTIKEKLKSKFLRHCQRHEFIPSRRIEFLMGQDINRNFVAEDYGRTEDE